MTKKHKPATATNRKSVTWNLTQEQIDSRLQHCIDPDVHGITCVCISASFGASAVLLDEHEEPECGYSQEGYDEDHKESSLPVSVLPTSDFVLAKLCLAILPANHSNVAPADTWTLYFLRDLAELCYLEEVDLARAFFEYFCRDPYAGVIADLLKTHPDCEDIISETLESTYSHVEADPQTGEPRGIVFDAEE